MKDYLSSAYGYWYSVHTNYLDNNYLMLDNIGNGTARFRDIDGLIYLFPIRDIELMLPRSKKLLIKKGLYDEEKGCCIEPYVKE